MKQASAILRGHDLAVEPVFEERLERLLAGCRMCLPSVDEELIRRAFRLAYWAHRNDRRATGEPYIVHPLEVAEIVVHDIGFDDLSVAAAFLHDVVEDTELSLDFIREEFGETMANIVDGVTKISGVFASRELGQAENVRKLMLSMATDIRVILVKFADRLHNMRTIDSLPRPKQIKIATETLELFAPLAHRFGLNAVKSELEDLSLKVLNPEAYREIVSGLKASQQEREAYIRSFIGPLKQRLEQDGFRFEIYGRSKNLYSIYRKMKRQDKPLDEIYDVFAIRIVLESEGRKGKEDCWRVYSIVTDLYKPLPERFRDFISVPKSNGYQSLHTTVLGPEGRRVEVQIRTREMHEIAERGVAAHWKYKEGVTRADPRMEQFLEWVRDLLENPRPEQATEFVREFRLNLYEEEIYAFTPRGDLMTLPRGATPVDFAFKVHTEVGLHCIGAKVNGKMVPLSYKLQSGDQVEIITSKKQSPNPDWIKFVVTHKARSRIRHWINESRRKAIEHGRGIWQKRARRAGLEVDEQELNRVANRLKFPNQQQLFYEIGVGLFDADELVRAILRERDDAAAGEEAEQEKAALRLQYESFLDTAQASGRPALMIDGELHTDIVTKYATCCNPIPGDEVFGYVSRTGSIKIHRVNCRNAPHLLINHPDRVVPVEWSRQKDVQFVAALRIMGEDRVGIVSDITTVISKNLKTNIRSITVDSEDGVFEGTLVLYVSDLEHLRRLIERIKRIDGIYGVYRFEEQADES
ncbi:bifunctional (p)ppGpp synthetase/guanosine-3',5'-bis(diphosphate) 3'-pyrophosphohydrolase [Rhodocaloribacter litoris]|uniref:RelA/SpoT family protein n=1 Tax=Rhodocaloribacter litoris TaxID=2558931 RepID=UPI0014249A37|nr:bifunctional (p)ppGpp synthetase/guanosine-3',5'-bis(diphosphate) 3'-pyrophosphohydrolase [Rhodocaloribacter litoris]QXD16703.1 bifunctional (p)ppGpp synthetase/guanosine-3',5'-bis(diphosphate) 3'-pyrophosphohydrolase [Rhodocaloribacter litoris]